MRMRPLAVAVLIAGPSLAGEGPAFDCSKAESAAEDLICDDAELAALDRRVADRYAAALAAVRALDVGAKEAEATLRAFQRGWIKGRDECWKAEDVRACVAFAYLRREGELVAEWLLEEPTATAFWICGGDPANEVVTMFFDTESPSIRFERGDSIDAGSLVRTASGSRHEGSFGRSIWIKGETASYRDADPDGSSHECVLAKQR